MGGLPCAKVIIDQGNAAQQVVGCMSATIQLAASLGHYPTEEQEARVVDAAKAFASIVQAVEKEIRTSCGAAFVTNGSS